MLYVSKLTLLPAYLCTVTTMSLSISIGSDWNKWYWNRLSPCILTDGIRNTIHPLFHWLTHVRLKGPLLQQLASVNINQAPALLRVSPPAPTQSLDQRGRASGRPSVNQPAPFPLAFQNGQLYRLQRRVA